MGPDLDPFLFLRYAKTIVENGSLPERDFMRYVPLGFNPAKETVVLPYMIAYFHKFLSLFANISVNYSAIVFPAVVFVLTAIIFFLLVNQIFKDKGKKRSIIALVATALFVVFPAILPRNIAGIPEKESVAFFFMFLSFYLFLLSWNSTKKRNSLIFSSFAGISTGIMGLIWGGWIYLFVTIGLFSFMSFLFEKIDKQRFYGYFLWLVFSYIVPLILSRRIEPMSLLTSSSTAISNIVFLILLTDFIIFNTKLKEKKIMNKFSRRMTSIVVALIPILILSIFIGTTFLPHLFKDVIIKLTNPYIDRLSLTVAENKQSYFGDWKSSFGPVIFNIPLVFWLFFIGSIFLFYEIVEKINLKERIFIMISYILFLFTFIFSRYSSSSIFNGVNGISLFFYFGGIFIFVLSLGYVLYKSKENLEGISNVNINYLFLFSLFLVSLLGARSAVRLIMVLTISAAILTSYFFISFTEKFKRWKTYYFISIGIVLILGIFVFYQNYQTTIASAKSYVPSSYTQQWQKAMDWVRENTPQDAVFSSWWDYGYWIQSIGERATVLDGGNSVSYWDYLLGRHVLTGQNEREALEFLYAHNVSYLLIDPTDVGKYGAYSNIGSDINYDRYSWIGTYTLDEKNTVETKNGTNYLYLGGVPLDEDYVYIDNKTGNQILFPSGKTGVGGIILPLVNDKYEQPRAIFIYNNQQISFPLRYAYIDEKLYDFGGGYGGCIYILPLLEENSVSYNGKALFLSERNMRALWVKLYLLKEGENFQLVHSEQDFLVNEIKNQGISIGDFVYYGDFKGPIKIWKVNYPKDIEFKKEYLSTDYPSELKYV